MIDGILHSDAETIKTNTVKLTFQVSPEKFEEGLKYSYTKNKDSVNIQGFRKGKVPRVMVERIYGKTFFYSDAVDYVFDKLYPRVLLEHQLNPVQNPTVDVKEVSGETGVAFEIEMVVEPLVAVKNYFGIPYEPFDAEVKENEITAAIDRDSEKNARVVTIEDRPSQKGDTVIIDFAGTSGGEPFEGGDAEDYELLLGSGSFVDDFEEQLEGHNANDKLTVDVTFPAEYPNSPSLAGKDASFDVTVKEIRVKEYPELDDDFAQDVSDFDTFEEYRADIAAKISENKTRFADGQKYRQVVDKLIESIEGEIPQVMFESMSERLYEDYKQSIKERGIDYETYLKYSGDSDERVRESAKTDAEARVRIRLALTAVVEQESIAVTDEEIADEIAKMAESYELDIERLTQNIGDIERHRIKNDLKVQKALKAVLDAAVPTEDAGGAAPDGDGPIDQTQTDEDDI